MIKKTKKEKPAKHKRKRNRPTAHERRSDIAVTELEKMAVRRALLAELIPTEWLVPDVDEIAELEPEEAEVQTLPGKAKEKKEAKRKRAKQKSAAKDKARKRKVSAREKLAVREALAAGVAPYGGTIVTAAAQAESRPKKGGGKAADGKAKKERVAEPVSAKPDTLPRELPEESEIAETERVTVRQALLVEPVSTSGAVAPRSGVPAGDAQEIASTADSIRDRHADQPRGPAAHPLPQGAADSPSRFWPGVALGTVAVILGFGYIRHLAREQVLPAPVIAESERAAPSVSPTVADAIVGKTGPTGPRAPSVVRQPSGVSTGPVAPDEPVQLDETASKPPGSAPRGLSRTTTQHQEGLPTEPGIAVAQLTPPVPAPPAGASREQAAGFRPQTTAPPAAQCQVIQPRVPMGMARWQMPGRYQPYQAHRPQFQPVPPGYRMYICPSEPRVLTYSGARDSEEN